VVRVQEELLERFADLLDYPRAGILDEARRLEGLARTVCPESVPPLERFLAFVESHPLGRVEEVYCATFDLGAACHPYVGHHLFGDSYKRSAFLVELKRRHRESGVSIEGELPDHLPAVLRLLARQADRDFGRELLELALLPAVERMCGRGGGGEEDSPGASEDGTPYRDLLEALRLALRAFARAQETSPCSTPCCS
jgi:nitrate reductase delta subunit